MRKLPHNLRIERRQAGLSQADMAALFGVRSLAKLSRYENLRRLPSLTTALGYEAILGKPVAELFAGSSGVEVVTPAAFVITVSNGVAGSTCTTSVTVADAPFATAPRLQVTAAVPVQVPCDGVAETNDVPAGSVSFTVTACATEGPPLDAVIV